MQVIRQVRLVIQQQHRFLSCVIPCEGTIKQVKMSGTGEYVVFAGSAVRIEEGR